MRSTQISEFTVTHTRPRTSQNSSIISNPTKQTQRCNIALTYMNTAAQQN